MSKTGSASKIKIDSFDDLFGSSVEENSTQAEKVVEIPLMTRQMLCRVSTDFPNKFNVLGRLSRHNTLKSHSLLFCNH